MGKHKQKIYLNHCKFTKISTYSFLTSLNDHKDCEFYKSSTGKTLFMNVGRAFLSGAESVLFYYFGSLPVLDFQTLGNLWLGMFTLHSKKKKM